MRGTQSWSSGKYPLIEHEYDAIVVYVYVRVLFKFFASNMFRTVVPEVLVCEQRLVLLKLDSTLRVSPSCSPHEVILLLLRYVIPVTVT